MALPAGVVLRPGIRLLNVLCRLGAFLLGSRSFPFLLNLGSAHLAARASRRRPNPWNAIGLELALPSPTSGENSKENYPP